MLNTTIGIRPNMTVMQPQKTQKVSFQGQGEQQSPEAILAGRISEILLYANTNPTLVILCLERALELTQKTGAKTLSIDKMNETLEKERIRLL